MKKIRSNRFDGEDVDPMHYLSNLSDAMLVLAVGMMLALIVHWNVDISTTGGTMSDSGMTYAEGEGGSTSVDRDSAVSFSEDELAQMPAQDEPETGEEGMQRLGEVFYDEATGQYYIVPDE